MMDVFVFVPFQLKMGSTISSPAAPTVRAEAMMAVPPQGCPMHQEAQPVKGTAAVERTGLLVTTDIIMKYSYIMLCHVIRS